MQREENWGADRPWAGPNGRHPMYPQAKCLWYLDDHRAFAGW
jgi:hypothetical protein